MIYKFLRDGIEEEVKEELWQWMAIYNDGRILKQFDDDGIFHQIGDIDQENLTVFKMFSKSFTQVYAVPFSPETMRLVHKYIQTKFMIGTDQEKSVVSYCFGYKTRNLPQNHQHLLIISPTNEAIICGDENIINFE